MKQASPRYGAVILAGGLSTRLGRFKPLVQLGGKTLLQRAAELFRETGVQDIVVVAGHRAPETQAEAARLGLNAVVNEAFAQGMFTSVQAGLGALPPGVDAIFVQPVDIPLVRPHTVRLLQERFATAPAAVLHPVFAGERGHPPLICSPCAPELLAWTGSRGLAGALAELESRLGAVEVPVADQNIHFDVDTPEDLAEASLRFERRGVPTPSEALALLDLYQAGERGHAHGRGVAQAALALARALNAQGGALDLALVEAAALLHDIAKGQPRHEAAGAALLDSLGFARAARIVAAHRDIAPEEAPAITEREVVYFADKLVWGSRRVSVEARFQQKLDVFADDPEACAAIRRRLGNALDMRRRIESATGARMEDIVPMQASA